MRSPKHVRPGQASQVLTGVSQFMLTVDHCPAQSTSDFLNSRGFPSICMSAVQDQSRRLLAINSFKNFTCRILCSTDLTARGIDAENVNLVVNLEVPWDHNTYLHRIGRGGRFGSLSNAVTLVSRGMEETKLQSIVNKTGSVIRILPEEIPSDLKHNIEELEIVENVEPVEADIPSLKKAIDSEIVEGADCDTEHGTDLMAKVLNTDNGDKGFIANSLEDVDDVLLKLNTGEFVPKPRSESKINAK